MNAEMCLPASLREAESLSIYCLLPKVFDKLKTCTPSSIVVVVSLAVVALKREAVRYSRVPQLFAYLLSQLA